VKTNCEFLEFHQSVCRRHPNQESRSDFNYTYSKTRLTETYFR